MLTHPSSRMSRTVSGLLALVFSLVLMGESMPSLACPHHGPAAEDHSPHDQGHTHPLPDPGSADGDAGHELPDQGCDCPGMCPVSGTSPLSLTSLVTGGDRVPPPADRATPPTWEARLDPQLIPHMHPYAMAPPQAFL